MHSFLLISGSIFRQGLLRGESDFRLGSGERRGQKAREPSRDGDGFPTEPASERRGPLLLPFQPSLGAGEVRPQGRKLGSKVARREPPRPCKRRGARQQGGGSSRRPKPLGARESVCGRADARAQEGQQGDHVRVLQRRRHEEGGAAAAPRGQRQPREGFTSCS